MWADPIAVAELLRHAHKHMYKLELSKHCFSPPVPANERDTEAWDTARLITPQNRSCNWLQPKHFTLPPRSANRSHSSLSPLLFLCFHISCSLSHSLSVISPMTSLSTLWSSCATSSLSLSYTCFFFPLKARFSRRQRERERERDTHTHHLTPPLIPLPPSNDADWQQAIVTVPGCHSNQPWQGPNQSRHWTRIQLLFSQL